MSKVIGPSWVRAEVVGRGEVAERVERGGGGGVEDEDEEEEEEEEGVGRGREREMHLIPPTDKTHGYSTGDTGTGIRNDFQMSSHFMFSIM
ncbi:hypothetical protein EYF80_016321 [Liparis tanakae]|uniref:Uncharacterized protein n=1 Tax=Liparis tanakae TaxID=230148 RepID=A0A4Z2I5S2_9TELE|nr:hypothetical protein EYF80_016321 [Liparis tanakae]